MKDIYCLLFNRYSVYSVVSPLCVWLAGLRFDDTVGREKNKMKFGMSSRKEEDLLLKMERLGIREDDLVEKFVRSPGPGGQKVNKTSTCVYLKHLPTGTEVKCSRERSRALNRFLARRILVDKIEAAVLGRRSERRKRIEKIRRQKRKRSRRAKERILEMKKRQSEKKARRRPPESEE